MDDSSWVDEYLGKWPLISPHPVQPPLSDLCAFIAWRMWYGFSQEIRAYHLFTSKIAKKLQEGELDQRDWYFSCE